MLETFNVCNRDLTEHEERILYTCIAMTTRVEGKKSRSLNFDEIKGVIWQMMEESEPGSTEKHTFGDQFYLHDLVRKLRVLNDPIAKTLREKVGSRWYEYLQEVKRLLEKHESIDADARALVQARQPGGLQSDAQASSSGFVGPPIQQYTYPSDNPANLLSPISYPLALHQPSPYADPYTQGLAQALDSQSEFGKPHTEEKGITKIGENEFNSTRNYRRGREEVPCNSYARHHVAFYGAPGYTNGRRRASPHAEANYNWWLEEVTSGHDPDESISSSAPSEGYG